METRNETITMLIDDFILKTTTSWETFAQNVVDHYHSAVPDNKRSHKFHTNGDIFKDGRANAQLVKRLLHGESHMRVEIEESLIEALPDEWRTSLKTALAARMGLLASKIPSNKTVVELQHIGQLAKEFSDFFEPLTKAYADNDFNEDDAHLADKILKEGHELMAVIGSAMDKAKSIKSRNNVHILQQP